MRTEAYLKRLAEDLDQWVRDGLIDATTAHKLRAYAGAQAPERSSSPILTSLAGLVIGLGVLTIIAANWSALTGVMRLGLVGALISAAMLSAGYLRDRALDLPSNILAAIAVLLAGGGVIVIGQLYHSSATNAAFLSLWTGLGLLIALTQRSPLAAAGTGLLALAWSLFHFGEAGELTRLPEPIWALGALALLALQGARWRSLLVLNIISLGVIVWLSWNVTELYIDAFNSGRDGRVAYALFALWGGVALVTEALARLRPVFAVRTLAGWASWTATACLLMGLATERVLNSGFMAVIAIASLAIFSALTAYGAAPGRRWFRGAGVAGFIGAAIILFTYSTNLVTAGFTLIVFGAALTALLLVTRRRQAPSGERAS
ncbi:DUF2157 domain-containing protein [Oceanicaulis sp. MMSF_3324]|uniref:DUF2157 domain-containing protein n=1 Tax=Oceanicaulis sp. MMSF_3324 TaxID=3046702 RepID=UPI0027400E35|nr:DUF2157 domain-containing protein [Oceanicaulis sp. MMSF_3324]